MRISDWSSDVCASDLERFLAEQSDKLGEGPRFWELKTNLTGLYADMTVDFVAQHSERPWFVNLWLNDMHDPWAPDDESLSDVMGKGTSSDDDRMLASLVKMDKTLGRLRSEEHTSELPSLMRISYAVFCLKNK